MRIALLADYHGGDRVWPLLEEALEDQRLDLIVFAGDIINSQVREEHWQKAQSSGKKPKTTPPGLEQEAVIEELAYHELFVNLTGFGVPVVYIPGHLDAPTSRLVEVAKGFPQAVNVHHHPVEIGGYTFVGWGGGLGKFDMDETFYVTQEKSLPRRFAEGLDLDPQRTIMVVHTPPVSSVDLDSDSNTHIGSRVINKIIQKHQPVFCLCGHAHDTPGQDTIGSTLVVNPGPMFRGRYALLDLTEHRVIFPTPLKV